MECVACGEPALEGSRLCPRCSTGPPPEAHRSAGPDASVLSPLDQALSGLAGAARAGGARAAVSAGALPPGALLGPRYEIVRLLGKGGMGAVYLARDRELDRRVAVKLIAPHLAAEPGTLERFKREIQLSSIVTHPNVLRVYDLGESDGVKFLTMQYIEGETLADLLRRERPLPLEKALSFFRQICGALAAAHDNGVLHRDLKPQNVMLDAAGRAYLTDFGLARSSELSTMTQVGALMGTPQYMSPEQVKALPVDARSDIFSIGVMLYEMLAGALPFPGDTLFEVMIKRTQAPPPPARELNPRIPPNLQAVLDRCLAIDPVLRYGSVHEILRDLDAETVRPPRSGRPRRRLPTRWIAASVALLLVLTAALAAWRWRPRPGPVERSPQTVLIADFANQTGDPLFDGTLEPALGLALEGASFVTVYNRSAAQKLADQLKLEGSGLDDRRARLVAQREGVHLVVSGSIARAGRGYRVSIGAADAFTGNAVLDRAEEVPDKEQVLAATTKLAARVRAKLGDPTPEALQMKEAETFSAGSVDAAHAFSTALDLVREGKSEEARAQFLESLKLDPGLGRSYIALANMEENAGHHAEAERYLKEAMARLDRMTEREKHRSRGSYYLFRRDADRALEAYGALVKQFPADATGLASLAVAYELKHDFPRALAEARRSLQIFPRNYLTRHNVGLYAMFSGDFEGAILELQKVVEQTPRYAKPYVGLALAQELGGHRQAALGTWEKLRRQGPDEATVAVEGLADLAVLEGRLSDALATLEAGMAADGDAKQLEPLARKLVMAAEVHAARGDSSKAIDVAGRALASKTEDYVTFAAARLLAEAGEDERPNAIADDLDRQLAPEPRMYAELLRGVVQLHRASYPEAIARLKSAGQRVDSWLVHLLLGRAYLQAGAFAEAQDELERCVKRRGEVADVYLDDVPSYRLYGPVQYYLGRAAEGLRSSSAADAYRAFLALKASEEDPMVADARRRLGNR